VVRHLTAASAEIMHKTATNKKINDQAFSENDKLFFTSGMCFSANNV
jgi:hypothetical protein